MPLLPDDMWRQVMNLLDAPSLMACRQTSRELRLLGRGSSFVGYRRELHHRLAEPQVFGRLDSSARQFAEDVLRHMSAIRLGQPSTSTAPRRLGRIMFNIIALQTPRARRLEVYAIDLGGCAVSALAARPAAWPVRQLIFDQCRIPHRRLSELLAVPCLQGLQELNLSDNACGDQGAELIASLPGLSSLTHLVLEADGLTGRGLAALCASGHLTQLRTLVLGANSLDLMPPLGATRHLPRLDTLRLVDTHLGADGLHELLQAHFVPTLAILQLDESPLGAQGGEAIARAANLESLAVLQLGDCGLGPHGAWSLAASQHLSTLLSLQLAGNQLGDEGAYILAESQHLRHLEELDLRDNGIGNDGAACLARGHFIGPQMQALLLDDNPCEAAVFFGAVTQVSFDLEAVSFAGLDESMGASRLSYRSFFGGPSDA